MLTKATDRLCLAGCILTYVLWQLLKIACALIVWALDR